MKVAPCKSLWALSWAKCCIKYARKIIVWSMENLYTLAKFFIIKIMENFYKQLHLRELSLFITCGGRGRGQGWRALSVEGFARVTITWYPSMRFSTFFLRSLLLRSHFQFIDIQFSMVFFRRSLWAKTDSPLSPPEKPCDPPKFSTYQAINNDRSLHFLFFIYFYYYYYYYYYLWPITTRSLSVLLK